ncbi:MAG: hypothetical protein M1823_005258 [Watsoniomyces obsoletus]|nr:MAG: hypothetical protein M1823_005258 [Watsoniomyces obsoletus]
MTTSTYVALAGEEHAGRPPSQASSPGDKRRRQARGRKDVGYVGQAGWASSVINLVNTIIGAGVLAMPLALSHMGILLGTLVIIWAGLTSAFGLYLQTRCARYLERGTSSFFALSQLTYPNAAVVFDAAIAIKCFGVGVSYLIIIGDLMPGVVQGFGEIGENAGFLGDRHFWITAFMLVIIPLCFLRRLDSLKYTSLIALVAIGYLVILVLAHFIKGDIAQDRGPVRVIRWAGFLPTLSSFPVVVFAYTCHQNMFPILNELKINSPARTTGVVAASIGSACSIYLLVAITGYLSFGDNVTGNIVGMYPPSTASTLSRAAIVVFFMLSYPLQVHPCRNSVDAVLKWRPKNFPSLNITTNPHDSHLPSSSSSTTPRPRRHTITGISPSRVLTKPHTKKMSDIRFAIITTLIISASYFVAMTVSSLERVLAYVGSTGSTSISFILPGLFYYKISDPESVLHQKFVKEDDDVDDDEEAATTEEVAVRRGSGIDVGTGSDSERDVHGINPEDGLLARSHHALLSSSLRSAAGGGGGGGGGKKSIWRKKLLRRLSLALACYGLVVMVVCLVTHTFFVVLH